MPPPFSPAARTCATNSRRQESKPSGSRIPRDRSCSRSLARGAQGPSFLFAGRFAPEKGLPVLFDAFARARPSLPGPRLRIVGDGPLLPSLSSLAERYGIGDAVDVVGLVQPGAARRPDGRGMGRRRAVRVGRAVRARRARRDRARHTRRRVGRGWAARDRRPRRERAARSTRRGGAVGRSARRRGEGGRVPHGLGSSWRPPCGSLQPTTADRHVEWLRGRLEGAACATR